MTKIYCEACGCHQPLKIDKMASDELNGKMIWGDLLCGECSLVINSIVVDKPGEYEFRRIEKKRGKIK